jgi:hypothetical protein
MADTFTVDPAQVVHETIEGETILIHLRTGTYYSLTGSGAELWSLLAAGIPVDRAAETLRRRYPADADEAETSLRRLADELVEEQLLVQAPNGAAAGPPPSQASEAAFEPPVMQRFTDMEYFLLLDPVHEADESAGWPAPISDD